MKSAESDVDRQTGRAGQLKSAIRRNTPRSCRPLPLLSEGEVVYEMLLNAGVVYEMLAQCRRGATSS
jgi:hypothetical protein